MSAVPLGAVGAVQRSRGKIVIFSPLRKSARMARFCPDGELEPIDIYPCKCVFSSRQ